MNEKEHDLRQTLWAWWFAGAGFFSIIQYFADPFDYKRRYHHLQPAPPWQQMK